jgi:hypothetical protein
MHRGCSAPAAEAEGVRHRAGGALAGRRADGAVTGRGGIAVDAGGPRAGARAGGVAARERRAAAGHLPAPVRGK